MGQPVEQWDKREKPKVLQDLKARWIESSRKAERVIQPGTDPRGGQVVTKDTPPNRAVLKLNSKLRKAESSVLVQARNRQNRACKVPLQPQSARNTVYLVQVRNWRRDALTHGTLLH
jgi:hypothetical protein